MIDSFSHSLDHLAQHGYAMLHGIFSEQEMNPFARRLDDALQIANDTSVLRSRGRVYGSRNLLRAFPAVVSLIRDPWLVGFTQAVLGPNAGIVRALFFDKPPDRSWHSVRVLMACWRVEAEHQM